MQSLSTFHKSLVSNITPCTFLVDPGRTSIEHCVMTGTTSNNTSTTATNQQNQPTPGTISMPPKIYRPHLPSTYIEPDLAPDVLDGMELLYKDHGKSLRKQKQTLPPRDDIIIFDHKIHQEVLEKNLKWGDCPTEYRPRILSLIKKYWDVFAPEGLRRHIRGYQCRIDTGDVTPICCKTPRYGPHEARIINKLVKQLEDNGLIEDDDGPWGALVVLAAKANQEHVAWYDYIWRLCVSYRRLNQVTRPFTFPQRRCDDAVSAILPKALFYLAMDQDSGYWQIFLELLSRAKLAFFTPTGKKRWTVMPMGALNSSSIFVAMAADLKAAWDELAASRNIDTSKVNTALRGQDAPHDLHESYGSDVIVDDILLYAEDVDILMAYFECALEILQHHRVTVKLKKCKFLHPIIEFVGVDITPNGNSPARSKFPAFEKLPPPETWADLRILIGMFGFYQEFIPLFQTRIAPWRKLQVGQPLPGQLTAETERSFFKGFWLPEHQQLLDDLKKELLSGLLLARPNHNRRFYVKTDWSKMAMGAILLQAQDDDDSILAEKLEAQGGPCFFELQTHGIRLRAVSCISRANTLVEQSYHSHTGEASVGLWAFNKWRKHLLGAEFTWIADSQGLKGFFEDDPDKLHAATHVLQRWRAALLMYHFVVEHRPARMLADCDALSRYNTMTTKWRDELPENKTIVASIISQPSNPTIVPLDGIQPQTSLFFLPPIQFKGPPIKALATPFSNNPYIERSVLTWNALGTPIFEALTDSGIPIEAFVQLEDFTDIPNSSRAITNTQEFIEGLQHAGFNKIRFDWFIAICNITPTSYKGTTKAAQLMRTWCQNYLSILQIITQHTVLGSAIIIAPFQYPNFYIIFSKIWKENPIRGWHLSHKTAQGPLHDAPVNTIHNIIYLGPSSQGPTWTSQGKATAMIDFLSPPNSFAAFYHAKQHNIRNASLHDQQVLNTAPAHVTYFLRQHLRVPSREVPVFSPNHPAPSIIIPRHEEKLFNGLFAIHYSSNKDITTCRIIRTSDYSKLLGIDQVHTNILTYIPVEDMDQRIRAAAPKSLITILLRSLHMLEKEDARTHSNTAPIIALTRCCPNQPIDNHSLISLPTHQTWVQAIRDDPDLKRISRAMKREARYPHRADLKEPLFLEALQQGQLELDNDILYYYDHSKTRDMRQLRRRVVPERLRQLIFIACHTSPFAGHSGLTRTLYRLQTRFWWPGMVRDATEGVKSCLHCNLTNATSHENQTLLNSQTSQVPFATVYLDIWSPGDIPDKYGNTKVLTAMDCLTGFVMVAFLQSEVSSFSVAQTFLERFVGTVGLPLHVVVDKGNEFAGTFSTVLDTLQIPHETASPENHRRIRNERFHRLLNKVQAINTADYSSFFLWLQGTLFAAYAWNATPADGTDIPRSVAAIGREFPFPIDVSLHTPSPNEGSADAQHILDHSEATLPFLQRQQQLLEFLNDDRRSWHNSLKNKDRHPPHFNIGDLVIVRRQIKSNAADGISAKLQPRLKGPYRVIAQISPSSYRIQKLPFLRGLGRPGRTIKENAARMTRLPSTTILHRTPDGADTQFGLLEGTRALHPLRKWLGIKKPGSYQQTPHPTPYAFTPIESMWSIEFNNNEVDDLDDDHPGLANDFPPQPTNTDSDEEDDGYDPQPRQNKNDGEFVEDITRIDPPVMPPQSVEKQEENNDQAQPKATEHRRTKRSAEQQQKHRVKRIRPNNGGKTEWSESITPPAPFPMPPKDLSKISDSRLIRRLFRDTAQSKHKLFVIAASPTPWEPTTTAKSTWQLIQVDWDQTYTPSAKQNGIFSTRRYRINPDDIFNRAPVDCRFSPDVWEWMPDQRKHVPRYVKRERLTLALQKNQNLKWPLTQVNLAEDLIVGPFDFSTRKPPAYLQDGPPEPDRIANAHWNILEDRAREFHIDTSNLRTVPQKSTFK